MSEVSCEICFNAFNDNDKIPKFLECGHTLCSLCLLKLFQSSKTCSKCSQPLTKSSAEEFPTNYFVLAQTKNGKDIKEASHKDSILARKQKIQHTVQEFQPLFNLVSSDLEKFPNQLPLNFDDKSKFADEVVLQAENHLWEACETLKLKVKEYFGAELFLKDFVDTHQFVYQISILCHQGGNVFAKHMVNGDPKYGEVIFKEGSIRIFSLSLSEVKTNSTIVLFSDLQTCINGRGMEKFELFIEFCGKYGHNFAPRKDYLLPLFLKLFTGEAGATFKGATFKKNGNYVNIGGYLLNGVPTKGALDYVSCSPEGTEQTFSEGFLLAGTEEGTLILQKNSGNAVRRNVIGTGDFVCLDKISDSGSVFDCGLSLKL